MKKVYLIATLVAIIAGIATYFFATQIQQNTKIKDAPTLQVVVAIVPIPENIIITADMVAIKQYIAVSVVPNSARKLEDVVGKLTRYPVVAGEQIVLEKLSVLGQSDTKVALSYQLQKDEYAYSVAVDNITGVSGYISKGDYVDIIYTTAVEKKITTSILMSNIHIIRVSNNAANYAADSPGGMPITAYSEVVFSLTKKQVVDLTQALSSGRITLALKSIITGQDEKVATTVQTTK